MHLSINPFHAQVPSKSFLFLHPNIIPPPPHQSPKIIKPYKEKQEQTSYPNLSSICFLFASLYFLSTLKHRPQQMASTVKTDPEEHNREDEENAPAADDEDTGALVAPIVKLEEVAVSTGEEDEDPILDLKAKLYRFNKEGNQWKERGVGTVKLLKHKVSGKVRLVMRQSKTLKICANHLVLPTMTVQEHAGNDKSCVWHATDFADGELKEEMFCIRFASVENCKTFMDMVQEVAESQGKKEETKDAMTTANLLEKLSVGESKSDEKEEEKVDAASKDKEAVEDKAKTKEEKKDEPASDA